MPETTTTVSRENTESISITRRRNRRRRAARILIPIIVIVALAVGGYELWQYFNTYESTDDAQIDGHIDAISARINGHLSDVLVDDAQLVKAGDPLLRIDPKD